MKLLGANLALLVLSATLFLISLDWFYFGSLREAAPQERAPQAIQATAVTFPEISEWDGALLEMLSYKASHCVDEVWISSPDAKASCDLTVVHGTLKLVDKAKSNDALLDFISVLGNLVLDSRTAGERSTSDRSLVSGFLTDFALNRAAILRGVQPAGGDAPTWPPPEMFNWIKDRKTRAIWLKEWHELRDEDCRAYPVAQCAEKLDLAFSRLMNMVPYQVLDGPRRDSAWRRDEENRFRHSFAGRRSEICLRTSGGDFSEAYTTCLDRLMDETFNASRRAEPATRDKPAKEADDKPPSKVI